MSDLDSKIRLTFQMYDFNQDDIITKEDVRIVLSYAHFERTRKQNNVNQVNSEGAYFDREVNYKERVND